MKPLVYICKEYQLVVVWIEKWGVVSRGAMFQKQVVVYVVQENYCTLKVRISNSMDATPTQKKKLPLKVIEISNKDMSSRKCLFYFLKIPEYSWKLSGGLLNNVAIFSWSRAIPSWFLLFVASLYLLNHRLWLVQKTPFFR